MVLINISVFFNQNFGDVDFDIFKNLMRYFLQLLLFNDSQILPGWIDFCAVYFSVSLGIEALRSKFS